MWSNLVSHPRRGLQLLGLFILMFGIGALMLPSLGTMNARGVSILDLEFMGTSENAMDQVARLGPSGVDAARMANYVDLPFLVAYAIAGSAACAVLAARAADRGQPRLATLGPRIAWFAIAVAALDALGDIAFLVLLGGHTDQPWPGLVFGFASAKYALLAAVIIYLVVGLARTLGRRAATVTFDN